MEAIERYGDISPDDLNTLMNQYEEVRRSGMVNMLDFWGVRDVSSNYDLHELAGFLDEEGTHGYAWLLKNYRRPER